MERLGEDRTPTIFMGDSLVAGWPEAARQLVFPSGSINFGANGDRTANLLWRIQQAIPDGAQFENVVLLVGTNDLGGKTSEQIVCAIESLVREVQRRSSGARIFVLEIPPRGPGLARFSERIELINRALPSRLGALGAKVVPIHAELLRRSAAEGSEAFFRDRLHFTPAGYDVLTQALRDAVQASKTLSPSPG